MLVIAKQKLQGVPARRQRQFGAGLATSEMDVVEVAGYLTIERREWRIDQQMVMTGIRLPRAGRRHDVHAGNAALDGDFNGNLAPSLRPMKKILAPPAMANESSAPLPDRRTHE